MEKLDFKTKAKRKLVENLLSIKVWVIFSIMSVSTMLVLSGLMSGDVWSAVNGGVVSTVCAMREIFKIQKIANTDEKDLMP